MNDNYYIIYITTALNSALFNRSQKKIMRYKRHKIQLLRETTIYVVQEFRFSISLETVQFLRFFLHDVVSLLLLKSSKNYTNTNKI